MLLCTAFLVVCALACTVTAQNPPAKNIGRDLTFALPSAIVLFIGIIITVIVVYMLYRAKRGYFCCLRPRYTLRRPVRSPDLEEQTGTPTEEGEGPADTDALPPSYQEGAEQRPLSIAPPDYQDALQDKILSDPEAPPAFDSPDFNQTTSSNSTVPSTEHPLEVTTPPPRTGTSTEATPPPYSESEEVPPPPISPVDDTPTELEDSEESYHDDDRTPLNP